MQSPIRPALILGALLLAAPAARGAENIRVIVRFHGEADASVFARHGGQSDLVLATARAVAGTLPAAAVAKVEGLAEVASVMEDGIVEAQGRVEPTQPSQSIPWGVSRIGADRTGPVRGRGVRVAVVDTGIDDTHPDFRDASGASRVVLGPCFAKGARTSRDDHNHGTHVAGILGASDNAIGVVGVAPECTPVAVKVLNRKGSGYDSAIIAGIDWAAANGCQVINLSLGGTTDNPLLREACDRAAAAGVLVVSGAGNSGDATPSYPGAYASVVCVAATDANDQKAYFSSTGLHVDLAAPGLGILSTVLDGGYAVSSGTSMATPHVAGSAALAIASGRYADAAAVRAALEATADDLNALTDPGRDDFLGSGLVDAEEAVTGLP